MDRSFLPHATLTNVLPFGDFISMLKELPIDQLRIKIGSVTIQWKFSKHFFNRRLRFCDEAFEHLIRFPSRSITNDPVNFYEYNLMVITVIHTNVTSFDVLL